MKALLVLVGILVLLALAVMSGYNGLVSTQEAVSTQWAQVQNVYQRRADLIPNLVKTVEGAANFEKSTLTEITEARASVGKVQFNNAPPILPNSSNSTKPKVPLAALLVASWLSSSATPTSKPTPISKPSNPNSKAPKTAFPSNAADLTKSSKPTTPR
jgi:hypothetical protein